MVAQLINQSACKLITDIWLYQHEIEIQLRVSRLHELSDVLLMKDKTIKGKRGKENNL